MLIQKIIKIILFDYLTRLVLSYILLFTLELIIIIKNILNIIIIIISIKNDKLDIGIWYKIKKKKVRS